MKKIYFGLALLSFFSLVVAANVVRAEDDDFRPGQGMGMMDQKTLEAQREAQKKAAEKGFEKGMMGDDNKVGVGGVGLSINPQGQTQVRGAKVSGVSGLNLTVTTFGLPIAITTNASTTRFIGVSDVSKVAVGDTVSVVGQIDPNTGVVAAKELRDESQLNTNNDAIRAQIQSLLDQLNKLRAQLGIR